MLNAIISTYQIGNIQFWSKNHPNDPKPASTTSGHPEITVWDMSPNNFSSIGPSTHPELGPPPVPVASRCLALAFLLTLALKSFKVWNNNQVI
jgi:hypothetical protein